MNKVYLDHPKCEHDWLKEAQKFENRWNFPNALGPVDGKHVMQAPAHSWSSFSNYKKTHNIILMAMCNARQQPTIVDIVDSARQRNGSVYNNSNLGYATENKQLKHRGKKKN